ncbi:conserved hypothetical protein [Ricinus communis]|uniref:Uncharacterized protein n=1 Tax=Ricinus communis TaxID=3988 RepID=B9R721_RICCO|nr:conserved hypothetical protein [Ricinus communis]
MEWWDKVMHPVRRVWKGVALRIGIRKRGLLKLRHDVRACEYEDVRIMWEMLRRTETESARQSQPVKSKKRCFWKCFSWARCSPYFGRNC